MKIKQEKCGLRIDSELQHILNKEILASGVDVSAGVNIRFKDPKYSSETGGYHPVEMAISDSGVLLYITDFFYILSN